MTYNDLKAYELIKTEELLDIASKGYLLKHRKTGARVLLIENDDENKVFNIGFRTPAPNSTGVPHILEHSVLCGSRKFPAKDPFVELVKGSLNTFLNAMTYPDKTMYPVASCNDKDFQNLMDVYLDAVFHPNIYDKEEIFCQEGWSYSLESEDAELKYNGVVYNEMKGAFSSPEGVLNREILSSLYPDTSYNNESGGDPDYITDLRYSEFLDFHTKYYHPSNSYIYLYGAMDFEEKLEWLDKEYLSEFDALAIDSEIKVQLPFTQIREVEREYSISDGETEKDNTYLSYNLSVGESLDKNLAIAFQILEYAIISAPGAPLKQALIDAGIGKDILGGFDSSVKQMMFSIVAKNTNLDKKDKFIETINDTLNKLVENKIDKNALKAGINYFEFRYREADYGRFPKGLMYGLQAADSWLYDENDPFMYLHLLDNYDFMKEQIESDYFESLIKKYLLENTHASIVNIVPVKGLNTKKDEEQKKRLKSYKESLSKEGIKELVDKTHALRKYQEEPSTKEELEAIPLLQREDIGKEAAPFYIKEENVDGTKFLHHEMFTSGIGYLTLVFDAGKLPVELIPYAGLLRNVLGFVNTKNFSYSGLFNEINQNSGGISTGFSVYTDLNSADKCKPVMEVSGKVLYDKLDFAFSMIEEILFTSVFEDDKRVYEIIAQLKSRLEMGLNSSGHSTAYSRGLSYFSPSAFYSESTSGVEYYQFISGLEKSFTERKEEIYSNLRKTMEYVFRAENMLVSYTADEEGFKPLPDLVNKFKKLLFTADIDVKEVKLPLIVKNEGFKTSSQVQYVARVGNFVKAGYSYTGALKVLRVIMNYDYLWSNIRVKGGAYGCMSGFTRKGDTFFVSYRDPNLSATNDVFEGVPDYIKNFTVDERDMTKYIIGTISDLDTPLNPSAKGSRSLAAYISGLTSEMVQQERDEILNVNVASIRATAPLVEAVLKEQIICALGNEEKIQESHLFKEKINLIS